MPGKQEYEREVNFIAAEGAFTMKAMLMRGKASSDFIWSCQTKNVFIPSGKENISQTQQRVLNGEIIKTQL